MDKDYLPDKCMRDDHRFTDAPDGTLVCKKCGRSFSRWGEELPYVPNMCPSCGSKITPQSPICVKCGFLVESIAERNRLLY